MARRKTADVVYHRFTHTHNGRWHECFYCGCPADAVDHFPPVSRIHDYRAFGLLYETYVKVSCCDECNRILSNTLQETLLERVEYLKDRLERRLRRFLHAPEWWEDELEELGPMLRTWISGHDRQRKLSRERLDYYEGVNAWLMSLEDYQINQEYIDAALL